MTAQRFLITGANGQIGTALVQQLRANYGDDAVLATDIAAAPNQEGLYERLDVLEIANFDRLVRQYNITQIYHLAAILSAKGEENPQLTWDINMKGLFNALETARQHNVRLFFPSSIAVFGDNQPELITPQYAPLLPLTVYGISKVAGENWCNYYAQKYGVDVRSLRYPGIISYQSPPGGGTTDYAVDIFHQAILNRNFTCFLSADTRLPMIYMDDAIEATLQLMSAPKASLSVKNSYNLAAISFTPAELAAAIQRHFPDFNIDYAPDHRQLIADSWPKIVDDREARLDWGWKPAFDLETMTEVMLSNLKQKYGAK